MGPFTGLPDVPGVDGAVDQVKRLEAFRDARPEWLIWCEGYTWHAERQAPHHTEGITAESLRFLLDELERR